eukprot:15282230-Alexandrium_andersonii.AAC.1
MFDGSWNRRLNSPSAFATQLGHSVTRPADGGRHLRDTQLRKVALRSAAAQASEHACTARSPNTAR